MKKQFILACILCTVTACQNDASFDQASIQDLVSFTAMTEETTKTSLDSDLNIHWTKGDQISVFMSNTTNAQYQVTDDSDGKTSAILSPISSGLITAGTELSANVGYYPYASSNYIEKDGDAYKLTVALPETQSYADGSFGNGAYPMVAVTSSASNTNFAFKNICGALKLQLTGSAKIASIAISGNNDEILSGTATITAQYGLTPSINITGTGKTVTLDCGAGVQLSSTATQFTIVLPPVTFSTGFTAVITDTEGKQMTLKTVKSKEIVRSQILRMASTIYNGTVAEGEYLTFTSIGSTSISLASNGTPSTTASLLYRKSTGDWQSYALGDTIALSDGDALSFKAEESGNSTFSTSIDDYYGFVMSGEGTVEASGNIMSLLDASCELTTCPAYCFANLFKGCTNLTTAPKLPATTLAEYCYYQMFHNCTSLTATPELPAATLAASCYQYMFYNCSSLTTAPQLAAVELTNYGYYGMFQGCTSLTAAPQLPATTLADYCYSQMFRGCTNLTSAPALPAKTMASHCYHSMFNSCSGLTIAPELPATSLAEYCYYYMFENTALASAPELPATTLSQYCYDGMFCNCKSLTTSPALPATVLAAHCYRSMFQGCTNLISAPELPANDLAEYCYYYMFGDCAFETAPELPATTLSEHCYDGMFCNCTNLISAPELPAYNLAEYCYVYMFCNCTSLKTAPELPSPYLKKYCYKGMFKGCSSLNYIKMLGRNTGMTGCMTNWVENVASSGTFVVNFLMEWTTRGVSAIPSGWNIEKSGGYESVDLGLSVEWSTMNVGATEPEMFGYTFAWAETTRKSSCSWSDYKYCEGTENTLTKYNTNSYRGTVDNKTTLDLSDDAAYVNMGSNWRMPTDAELTELREECTWTWTTRDNVDPYWSSAVGYTVTGPNGNSIFLLSNSGLYGTWYWSATLSTTPLYYNIYAYGICLGNDNGNENKGQAIIQRTNVKYVRAVKR